MVHKEHLNDVSVKLINIFSSSQRSRNLAVQVAFHEAKLQVLRIFMPNSIITILNKVCLGEKKKD